MDLYKRTNIEKATSCDYNAKNTVILRDRKQLSKMLTRYSRRKLKQEIIKESKFY